MLTIFRALAGLVLGVIVFAGLFYYLVFANFSERVVTAEVYYVAINDTDAYNRVYDEVLVDDAIREQTANLLGGVEFEGHDDAVALLREIMPPDYLREQTENNIARFTGYMRGDTDELELYVELGGPLERVKPAAQAEVDRFIDELEIVEPAEGGCSPDIIGQLAAASAGPLDRLSRGELPESAPSLKLMSRECRLGFDLWFDQVVSHPGLNSQAALVLSEAREGLRQPFLEGDTRAFLKAAGGMVVEPLADYSVADIRRGLQPGDRLDLIERLAAESEDFTREDIEAGARDMQELAIFANGPAGFIALAMAVGGCLLLALVHLPSPAGMLRWPGMALALGGGVCLVAGFVLNSAIPGQLNDAVSYSVSYSPDVPASAIRLAGDLLESLGRQATAGFVPAATGVMLLGLAMVAVSFLWGLVFPVVRRALPGRGG